MVLIGNLALHNDVQQQLFVGDIITIAGIILTFVGGTNLMVSQKVKQQKEASEIEVIEV